MVTNSEASSIHLLQKFDSFSDDDGSLPGTAGLSLADLRLDSAPPAAASSRPISGGCAGSSASRSVSSRSKQVLIQSPPIKSDPIVLSDEELLQFANNIGVPIARPDTKEASTSDENGLGTFLHSQPPNHISNHASYVFPSQIPKDVFTTPHRPS